MRKKLIELYQKYNSDKFYVGYIVFKNKDYTFLKCVDKQGFDDGYQMFRNKDVHMIKENTDYLERIKRLIKEYSKKNIQESNLFRNAEIKGDKNNLFLSVLNEAKDKKISCNLELFDKETKIYGFIDEIGDDFLVIKEEKEEQLIMLGDIINVYMDVE